MKKWLQRMAVMLIVISFALSAAGCAKESPEGESSSTEAEKPLLNEAFNGEKIKVALCIENKSDLSFNQSAYEGMMRVQEELGEQYTVTIYEMGSNPDDWPAYFYQAADEMNDIIIGTGYENRNNFQNIPMEYPETMFILLDQKIDYSYADLSNVLTITFQANQAGFLAGAAAAWYTKSEQTMNPDQHIIGFIGGKDIENINEYLIGYVEGARFVEDDIKVLYAYVGDFADTKIAKELADEQIAAGADVIFQAAGSAGNGVLQACTENEGVKAIGVDSDQYQTLSGTNLQSVIMTSALKRMDQVIYQTLADYAADPKSVPFGTTMTVGLKTDAVGIVFNENLNAAVGEELVQELKDTAAMISSREIVVTSVANLTKEELLDLIENKKR